MTAAGASGVKHSVFFDDVRIHESYLVGGDKGGWKAATATLTVEHGDREGAGEGLGAGAEITRSVIVDRFLNECKSNPNIVKRLKENPQLVDILLR